MRVVSPAQILVYALLVATALALAVATTAFLFGPLPLGDFRGVALTAAGAFLFLAYAIVLYRAFLFVAPLEEGEIAPGSRAEFRYHVHLLFNQMVFQPLTRSFVVPVPLARLLYIALGAKLGTHTYSAGLIFDPPLMRIGRNTLVGHDAMLASHIVEGDRLYLATIEIGDDVTIGAKASILPGVKIGDGAIVALGAVVTTGTRIGAGELWGGTPARFIKRVGEAPRAGPGA